MKPGKSNNEAGKLNNEASYYCCR